MKPLHSVYDNSVLVPNSHNIFFLPPPTVLLYNFSVCSRTLLPFSLTTLSIADMTSDLLISYFPKLSVLFTALFKETTSKVSQCHFFSPLPLLPVISFQEAITNQGHSLKLLLQCRNKLLHPSWQPASSFTDLSCLSERKDSATGSRNNSLNHTEVQIFIV